MKRARKEAGEGQKSSSAGSQNKKKQVIDRLLELVTQSESRDDILGATVILRNVELFQGTDNLCDDIARAYARILVRAAKTARKNLLAKRKINRQGKEHLQQISTLADRLCHYLRRQNNPAKSEPVAQMYKTSGKIDEETRRWKSKSGQSISLLKSILDTLTSLLDGVAEIGLLLKITQESRAELLEHSRLAVKAADSCLSRLWPGRWTDWDKCKLFAQQAMTLLQAEAWHHTSADDSCEAIRDVTYLQLAAAVEAIHEHQWHKVRANLKSAARGMSSLHTLLAATL